MQAPRATFQAIAIYKDLVRAHTKNLKYVKQHSFILLLLFIIFLHLINLYVRGVEMPQENDGFMIAFPDIATAVNFCLRIQYGMRGWGSRDERKIQNNNIHIYKTRKRIKRRTKLIGVVRFDQ